MVTHHEQEGFIQFCLSSESRSAVASLPVWIMNKSETDAQAASVAQRFFYFLSFKSEDNNDLGASSLPRC